MGYGQAFQGTFAFKTAHHMEAGLDAMTRYLQSEETNGSFVTAADFTRATSRRLDLDMDVYGPASMHYTTIAAISMVGEYASSGHVRADYEGDASEYIGAGGFQGALPKRHRGYDLYHASKRGDLKALKTALKHGGDPDFELPEGQRPLLEAANASHVEAARLLLEAGASPEVWQLGWSTMHLSASREMVDLFHGAGVSLEATSPPYEDFPPLVVVCERGHLGAALRMIELGASVPDSKVASRLLYAAAGSGMVDVLAFVRHQLEVLPHEGLDRAMMSALRGGHMHCVRWCLDHGAKAEPRALTRQLCLSGMVEALALFLHHLPEDMRSLSAEPCVMGLLVSHGHLDALAYLHDHGWPVTQEVLGPDAPMFRAIARGNRDIVAWLLEQGCDPSQPTNHDPADTPLVWARSLEREDIAALLESHGAKA